ncbi:MAG: SDR family oxidoreductase [Bacteroidales bacterium]
MKETVLITGATSGIGASCARAFAQAGYRLIISGRRKERLQQMKESLEQQHPTEVLTLQLDVRDHKQVQQAIDELPEAWSQIDILVNNAGLARGLNTIDQGLLEDWDQMIDTNVKGMLYVTRTVSPGMVARKRGHIINIGSVAGREVYPKGNVYCATKHAVNALNQGMRIDLVPHGIKVTQVSPGAVETEFSKVRFHGDEQKAKEVYKGFTPLSGDDVAGVVMFVATLPPHVNVNDILVMPTAQAAAGIIHKE